MFRFKYLFLLFVVLSACNNQEAEKVELTDQQSPSDDGFQGKYKSVNEKIKLNPNDPLLYLERAKINFEANYKEEALGDVQRGLSIDSLLPELLVFKADLLFNAGKTIEAKQVLEKCIQANSNYVEAHLKLAELNLYASQYAKSIQHINDALKIDMYLDRAYFMKGMNYKFMGDTVSAISSFQTAVEQNPEYYDAFIQLGLIFADKNNPLAEVYYNNAIQVKPTSVEAWYNKSFFLQENNKLEAAIEGYKTILKIQPSHFQSYYNIGYIHLVYLEQYDSAAFYFDQTLLIQPNYPDAIYNMGLSYELQKNNDKAVFYYRKVLQFKPDHTLAAKGLQRILG
jgi:tetratricopeptide (TPR) repeat protein